MKNLLKMKAWAVLGLFAALMVVSSSSVSAKSVEQAQIADLTERTYIKQVNSSSSTLLTLYYVGAATEAVVDIDEDSIDAEAPDNTSDTDFGSSGSYDMTDAAYDTMGELCDAIDNLTNYGCFLNGAKRDDSSLLLRNQASTSGTNDLKAVGGFEVKGDTGAALGGPANAYSMRLGFTPEKGKRIILKKCEWSANGATDFRVYGKRADQEVNNRAPAFKPATYDDTDEVFNEDIVDDAVESYDWTLATEKGGLAFAKDAHVVVSVGNSTNLQFADSSYLRCQASEK